MADSVINFTARIFRPILIGPARLLAGPKKGATWHYEAVLVALVLLATAALTGPNPLSLLTDHTLIRPFLIIWLSAAAVFGSFMHAQIGTFMAEDMGAAGEPLTPCYHKLGEYWMYKEIFWLLVFFISGAYPAIVGNIIFLIYPAWRTIYKEERRKRGIATNEDAPLLVAA